ncbi:PTS system, glucose subfamily, IIA component [Enterococcus phoeniculicola]|jgi:glucose-specific phosphotransferase system IIA component|uniref:PTS system, glucose subfamily, IIA component n=1 Tax=Enterococcus phoeniculicola ATCC BAA-412 TaxID=1158610 RepID=R3WDL1_9ENTE|nr:PTS glucose transporter subunit IIA [Enterococcus phoeniculicola]EOL45517.1 PTS system, glucose subfamily, IIA component [Enterococcus phoeniculicola ATCC BAA-412]EOT74879.1 hypothetical protein I589_02479 [Enterococcus phoeniculicola ATCC BAA-412]OJG73680.1 PTS system, glucose subfamily, IIA component [Enterococcus phoeniculicola]
MFFSKKNRIYAPVAGTFVPLKEVNDPVFAQGMMGDGVAVEPKETHILSPVDGTVTMISEQQHGIGIQMEDGTDLLIHMGIDTVELGGTPFLTKVAIGDKVSSGDLLSIMDIEAIQSLGKETVIMLIATGKQLSKVQFSSRREVEASSELARI